MELDGKKVVVIGIADSGTSAARLLVRLGAQVIATDLKPAAELAGVLKEIDGLGVELALGGHPIELFHDADLIVTSPGVPKHAPPLAMAAERGIPVWSELELAATMVRAPILAVTGSNGKTTAVSLLGEIMKRAMGGDRIFVGGNIGTPLSDLVLSGSEADFAVVEVSSFQLEFAPNFHPKVAVMLNVTPDHLDRYRDFEEYVEVKSRIFQNQTEDDYAVINQGDPLVAGMAEGLRATALGISLAVPQQRGMWKNGDGLRYSGPGGEGRIDLAEVKLFGAHNLFNVMAASAAALAIGVSLSAVREAVSAFKGLPHRLELAREWKGIKFFNDSKATNAGAVEAAAGGLGGPVILLMGGRSKGCSFKELGGRIKHNVRSVVAFGESAGQIEQEVGGELEVSVTQDLTTALDKAVSAASPGDSVLLSPGCASFDQFDNYKERGDLFKRLVGEL